MITFFHFSSTARHVVHEKFDSLDLTIQNKILRRMVTFASDKILVIVDVDDKEDSDML